MQVTQESQYMVVYLLIRFLYLRVGLTARIDKICVVIVRICNPFKLKQLKTDSDGLLF